MQILRLYARRDLYLYLIEVWTIQLNGYISFVGMQMWWVIVSIQYCNANRSIHMLDNGISSLRHLTSYVGRHTWTRHEWVMVNTSICVQIILSNRQIPGGYKEWKKKCIRLEIKNKMCTAHVDIYHLKGCTVQSGRGIGFVDRLHLMSRFFRWQSNHFRQFYTIRYSKSINFQCAGSSRWWPSG